MGLVDLSAQRARMVVRFFGSWDFNDSDLDLDLAEVGYNKGVPMGSDMTPIPPEKTPTFLVAALTDILHLFRTE